MLNANQVNEVVKTDDGRYVCCNCEHDKLYTTGNRMIMIGYTITEIRCGECNTIQVHKPSNYM